MGSRLDGSWVVEKSRSAMVRIWELCSTVYYRKVPTGIDRVIKLFYCCGLCHCAENFVLNKYQLIKYGY